MSTFRNTTDQRHSIELLGLSIGPGETFEVPDEYAASIDANPTFASSKAKHPDLVPDPAVVEAVTAVTTAPIAVLPPVSSDPGPDPDQAA